MSGREDFADTVCLSEDNYVKLLQYFKLRPLTSHPGPLRRCGEVPEAFVSPNEVSHSPVILVLLTHLLKFFESRVISEDVPGLSDDSEAEFIPVNLGKASGMNLTVRLTVFLCQPFRSSGETICDTVCLSLDVSDLIVIRHQIALYSKKVSVVDITYVTCLILPEALTI